MYGLLPYSPIVHPHTHRVQVMYPITNTVQCSTTAPSLMIAVALAMSIDYSLFILGRFQQEVRSTTPPYDG